MIKRIEALMKVKNLTASQFADTIGIQRSGMSHILAGRNNPSLDFVLKVLNVFPEISPAWLLQGKGEMYANLAVQKNIVSTSQQELFSPIDATNGISGSAVRPPQETTSAANPLRSFSHDRLSDSTPATSLGTEGKDVSLDEDFPVQDLISTGSSYGNTQIVQEKNSHESHEEDERGEDKYPSINGEWDSGNEGNLKPDTGCTDRNKTGSPLIPSKQAVKIVFFYADGTFEMFYPR